MPPKRSTSAKPFGGKKAAPFKKGSSGPTRDKSYPRDAKGNPRKK